MAIYDILVHLDSGRACEGRVATACAIAARHDSHLAGAFVIEPPALPGYARAQLPQELLEARATADERAAAAAHAAFERAASAEGLRFSFTCHTGEPAAVLAREGAYADLLVVGQGDPDDGEASVPDLPDRVVLQSGRPVLLLPRAGAGREVGRRVLVAWNASRESVRAVDDALPLLVGADVVHVLTVNPERGTERGEIAAAGICERLARHGVAVEAESAHGAAGEIGAVVLGVARKHDVDLMVMGAYGHSRMREVLLGGATAHVLAHTDIPTLLAH